ncbi:MAG: Helix-turn-helix protein [Aeromicrobium sp.]|nr:Helix-turn-helix protein [Aeromicrobium sp.]
MADNWARAGEFLYQRRKAKGLTQAQVQGDGGPSTAVQRQVENGTYDASMHRTLRRGYEDALDLPRGSIDLLLADEEPDLTSSVGPDDDDGGFGTIKARKPANMSDEDFKRLLTEYQEEIEWKLDRAARER